jgi:hypothetical protein
MMTIGFYLHYVVTLPDTINAASTLSASSESYAKEATKPIPTKSDGILNLNARLQTRG